MSVFINICNILLDLHNAKDMKSIYLFEIQS